MKRIEQRVVVIQRILPHYRVAFFEALHSRLANRGVKLEVVYGQQAPGTVPKTLSVRHSWAKYRQNIYLPPAGRSVVWQPVLDSTRGADLVIVEHASRLLCNYILHVKRAFGRQRVAYWGHGANLKSVSQNALNERLKRFLLNEVDWWFAYTDLSREIICRSGFPEHKITVVHNSIDTSSLEQALSKLRHEDIQAAKRRLGLRTKNVGLYCGGMYKEKRLQFLLDVCQIIRSKIDDFEIIFIGDGPDSPIVAQACQQYRWMHWVGPLFGSDRAIYFSLSRVLLMPGLVGLVILDSFVSQCPIFTTNLTVHSPEIDYLEHGVNGWMTAPNIDQYASAIIKFLADRVMQNRLRSGCRLSASCYTLDNMLANFSRGIEASLRSSNP